MLDALDQKECPVCFLIRTSIDSYFKTLLYENINDLGFKKKFREQDGFCNQHSYNFLKYNDRLAVTLTHKDILLQKVTQYKKNNKIKPAKKENCMICELEEITEKRYLSVIIEYADDKELKTKFSKSSGLCIPHFEKIKKKIGSRSKWLLDFHKMTYEKILNQAVKYLEASNISLGENRPKLSPEDYDIHNRLVKTICGYEGMK